MDHFDLKQWRTQNQSEEPLSAKMPRLVLESPHGSSSSSSSSPSSCSALPLFVTEPNARVSNLSAFQESASAAASRFSSVFSVAQRQELELQALIFKYMLAGAPVPTELLQSIKSLVSSAVPSSYLYNPYQQQYQHYHPYVLQPGYWGRNVVDPEPGRCRRTDGKKWRCSRDVVAGQKYCERHVHRGRNRSRKPVEIATPAALKTADSVSALPLTAAASTTGGAKFAHSKPSPLIDFQLNQRSSESIMGSEISLKAHNVEVGGSEGQLLRHFFDERPKSQVESNSIFHNAEPASSITTTTGLSIAIPRSHSSGDFSLKLSTGSADHVPSSGERTIIREEQSHQSWAREWGSQQGSSMAGLLGEMLRSPSSNSPTSVLHELRRGCVSETSSIST